MMNDNKPIETANSMLLLFFCFPLLFPVMVWRMCKCNYALAYVPERELRSDVASVVPIPREDYKALPLMASLWGLVLVDEG